MLPNNPCCAKVVFGMNPTDCSSHDWRLYFNHTIMVHEVKGLVEVQVTDLNLHSKKISGDSRWTPTAPNLIRAVWPLPGAINWEERALYIGRRARRQAHQSATTNHYYQIWTGHSGLLSIAINKRMLVALLEPSYLPVDEAVLSIHDGDRHSVAISRDLIINSTLSIIYKGHSVGQLLEQDGTYLFEATMLRDPRAKRAAFKLQKEGVLCL